MDCKQGELKIIVSHENYKFLESQPLSIVHGYDKILFRR